MLQSLFPSSVKISGGGSLPRCHRTQMGKSGNKKERFCVFLDNIPGILGRVAKFAARHAGAQAVVANTDRVIFKPIGEIIMTFGHCTHKDADTFARTNRVDVIFDADDWGIETQSDFAAIGWKMVGDWILDDFQ